MEGKGEMYNERKGQRGQLGPPWFSGCCSHSSCHFSIRREQKSPWPAWGQVTAGWSAGAGRLLTSAGVSRGDRSEKLLTGGSWHQAAHAPGDAASAHFSTGSWNRKKKPGGLRSHLLASYFLFTDTLFCYSLKPSCDKGIKHWYIQRCLILYSAAKVSQLPLIDGIQRQTGMTIPRLYLY